MQNSDFMFDRNIFPSIFEKDSGVEGQWRVKVFELNSDSNWVDQGTGHAIIQQEVLGSAP